MTEYLQTISFCLLLLKKFLLHTSVLIEIKQFKSDDSPKYCITHLAKIGFSEQ